MATFLRLWESRHSLQDELNDALRQAEIRKDVEMRATISMQSVRRGVLARQYFRKKRLSCKVIQRIYRGYLARQMATYLSMQRDKQRAHKLWTAMAMVIQRSFRGFHSRRYKHSYYERQAYLRSVSAKEEKVRELSEQLAESTYLEREQTRHQSEQAEFTKLAKDLHHLVSTSNIPGVFNSPYNVEPLRAFGAPVEAQLKTTFQRSQYLQRHMQRSLGKQRYTALHGHSMGQTGSTSGSYTHSSFPRPLEPLSEEPGSARGNKRSSRAA